MLAWNGAPDAGRMNGRLRPMTSWAFRFLDLKGGEMHKSHRSKLLTLMSLLLIAILGGCGLLESTEQKQIRACVEDVKLGLNDPNSLEIVSTRTFKANDGSHRLELKITAKNAMGGRVRGEAICGFKTEKDVELNPDDLMNQTRKLSRDLRELGIR
jgi:hypothetical protein